MRKPYYRKDRGAWYVKTDNGRSQIFLHADEEKAYKIWQEMLELSDPSAIAATVDVICEKYLDAANGSISATQFTRSSYYLAEFCKAHGTMVARELKPSHVMQWLDKRKQWGAWSRKAAIATLKRAYAVAFSGRSPLEKLKAPAGERRQALIDDAQHAAMMKWRPEKRKQAKREATFRQVLVALKHSGARPGEVAAVQLGDIAADLGAWVLNQHKTREKTRRPRVIYLSPCLQTLTKILVAGAKSTNLFVNASGKRWSSNAIRCRMRRLRKALKLPDGSVAYSYRHAFAQRALTGGVDIATVAELLGHTSTDMVSKHYGHLDKAKDHLKAAAAKAVRPKD